MLKNVVSWNLKKKVSERLSDSNIKDSCVKFCQTGCKDYKKNNEVIINDKDTMFGFNIKINIIIWNRIIEKINYSYILFSSTESEHYR